MSFETEIYSALRYLVGDRIFPDVAPLSTDRPYITWQKVGGTPINYTGNELPTQQHSLVQVNVWADTRLSANTISKAVEDALRNKSSISARPESEAISIHEPDLNLYGNHQEFSIFCTR